MPFSSASRVWASASATSESLELMEGTGFPTFQEFDFEMFHGFGEFLKVTEQNPGSVMVIFLMA